MKKRKWPGAPICSFCKERETSQHLCFECPVARCSWGMVAKTLGTRSIPTNLWQALAWSYAFVPGGKKCYMVGLTAICWSIWKIRNKVTFDNHRMHSPVEVIYMVASLLMYWAGLFKGDDKEALKTGANMLMQTAASMFSGRGGQDEIPARVLMITEA